MGLIMKFSYLGIMCFDHTHSIILSFPTSNKLLLQLGIQSPSIFLPVGVGMGVTLELLGGAPINEVYKHTGPCRWSHC